MWGSSGHRSQGLPLFTPLGSKFNSYTLWLFLTIPKDHFRIIKHIGKTNYLRGQTKIRIFFLGDPGPVCCSQNVVHTISGIICSQTHRPVQNWNLIQLHKSTKYAGNTWIRSSIWRFSEMVFRNQEPKISDFSRTYKETILMREAFFKFAPFQSSASNFQ